MPAESEPTFDGATSRFDEDKLTVPIFRTLRAARITATLLYNHTDNERNEESEGESAWGSPV